MYNEKLLEVRNLVTCFETESGLLRAVDDVSFDIYRGECVGIVGESGCGKSVTAMSLMRLLPKPEGKIMGGSVIFGDRDILKMSPRRLRAIRGGRVGVIFQEPLHALNPVQTVGQQIAEVLMLHRSMSAHAAWQEAIRMLEYVRIPDPELRASQFPDALSGGMRQRVVIAIALACRPDLLIADEPTTALDVTVQQQILSLIRELREELNAGALLITHDLGVIAQNCDRVLVMYAGRIVESANVFELFSNPLHAYTRALLASTPRMEYKPKTPLPTIPNSVAALGDLVPGCRFCQRMGVAEEELLLRPKLVEPIPGHWVEACPRCSPEVFKAAVKDGVI